MHQSKDVAETGSQLILKITDSPRQRTLVNVDALAGPSEVQFLGNDGKVAKVSHLNHSRLITFVSLAAASRLKTPSWRLVLRLRSHVSAA
ncbi:hypothetical protein [Acidovorax sp. LjRoot117]|uniref:hypothetical protein n=1 Tax=Acidovorax sp. LjRoot117 TaxID=3342255 RepID=UPI003F4F4369